MLEKDGGFVAAQGAAQQADRVLGIGGHREAPPQAVYPLHFVRLAMPRIATFEKTAGNTHHHRGREAIRGTPAHGAAIIELLRRGVGVFAKLDLGHRHEARGGHAHGPADDAFLGQTGIEYTVRAELLLQSQRGGVHTTLAAHVLSEHQHARIDRKFVLQCPPHRRDEIDTRTSRLGLFGTRFALRCLRATALPAIAPPQLPSCRRSVKR